MDTEEYRRKIEKEVLEIIENKLKAGQMDAARAREIAGFILETLHSHMDINQIHAAVQDFDDHFKELVPIVIQVSNDYENKVKQAVGEHVRNLIKQNKIEEANDLLKNAIDKKVELKY